MTRFLKKPNIEKLINFTKNRTKTIEFCMNIGMLRREISCTSCGRNMSLVKGGHCQDNFRWRCGRPCRKEVSIRKGTFFEKSNLKLKKIIRLIYYWAFEEASHKKIKRELRLGEQTIVDWKNFLRDICTEKLLRTPTILGGLNHVVQIDETLMTRRKYNVGRLIREVWVFGGIDCQTKQCFLIEVSDRSAQTLMPLICEYVLPHTTVVSDCWAAYNQIQLYGYDHKTVNHSRFFVDPVTRVNTNRVENMWMRAKRRHKRESGTTRTHLVSYLYEFMWRQQYGDFVFFNILTHINERYPQ